MTLIKDVGKGVGLALVLYLLCPCPATAHHSSAMFDQEREITLQGVVVRVDWANPHVYFHVEGVTQEGGEAVWAVEAGPPNVMTRNGWSSESVTAGDVVLVTAYPPRSPSGTTVLGKSLLRGDGIALDIEASSQPDRLQAPGASEAFVADSLDGHWLTRWDAEAAARFIQPAVSWSLTAAGASAVESYNGSVNPGRNCVSQTVPFVMVWPALHDIETGEDVTMIRSEWGERVVFMNQDSHEEADFSNQGHSIGSWDNGTLVVDTARFSDHRSGIGGGLPSGSRKHLIERFELKPDGTGLTYTYEVEDPDFLAEPVAGSLELIYRPDLELIRIPCDPEVARRYLGEGR